MRFDDRHSTVGDPTCQAQLVTSGSFGSDLPFICTSFYLSEAADIVGILAGNTTQTTYLNCIGGASHWKRLKQIISVSGSATITIER